MAAVIAVVVVAAAAVGAVWNESGATAGPTSELEKVVAVAEAVAGVVVTCCCCWAPVGRLARAGIVAAIGDCNFGPYPNLNSSSPANQLRAFEWPAVVGNCSLRAGFVVVVAAAVGILDSTAVAVAADSESG